MGVLVYMKHQDIEALQTSKIVEHTHNQHGRMDVLHTIYFNDITLYSTSHLITYLNEVFENINYPFLFKAHTYNRKIFQNGVLERHDFDIYFSKQIGDMLGLDGIKLQYNPPSPCPSILPHSLSVSLCVFLSLSLSLYL